MQDETDSSGLYINAGVEFEPLREAVVPLHESYIDECADGEDKDFSSEAGSADWRKSANEFQAGGMVNRPDFSRFFANDWRSARIAANHLKFCPGDKCRQWLPLHNFSANTNTSDSLDVYCIQCNQVTRSERVAHNKLFQRRHAPTDKYEMFKKVYKESKPPPDPEVAKKKAVFREVCKRIQEAGERAKERYRKKFSVDNLEISRKLFQGGRHVCNVTGQIMTPECFLEHHTITFQLDKDTKKVQIICSQSRIGEKFKQ